MARRDPLPPLNPTRAFEASGRLLSISKAADELSGLLANWLVKRGDRWAPPLRYVPAAILRWRGTA